MGPEWVVLIIAAVIVMFVALTTRQTGRSGGSAAGHYDPDAIGQYRLDPATQSYRYELPTLPETGGPASPGSGPPHRRRRRRRRQTDPEGG